MQTWTNPALGGSELCVWCQHQATRGRPKGSGLPAQIFLAPPSCSCVTLGRFSMSLCLLFNRDASPASWLPVRCVKCRVLSTGQSQKLCIVQVTGHRCVFTGLRAHPRLLGSSLPQLAQSRHRGTFLNTVPSPALTPRSRPLGVGFQMGRPSQHLPRCLPTGLSPPFLAGCKDLPSSLAWPGGSSLLAEEPSAQTREGHHIHPSGPCHFDSETSLASPSFLLSLSLPREAVPGHPVGGGGPRVYGALLAPEGSGVELASPDSWTQAII